MSVEIGGLEIDLSADQKSVEVKSVYAFYDKYSLSKEEFAELIAALQAMHDKIGE